MADFLSLEFFQALISIVIIDLVLAGDNAIVIGLAARNLPKDKQKPVIIGGTLGAIVIRAIATLVVVWLLKIPGLLLVGGLILIWIGYKLLVEEKGQEDDVKASNSMWGAIGTIIVADAVMGLDNVLAIAGAAHGHYLLVIIGLLISVPVIVWGSTLILKWIERFPVIIYIGSGVLAWTAGKMIVDEPFLKGFFEEQPVMKYGLILLIVVGVLTLGRLSKKKQATQG
ncbi:MAG: TerC family protein [Firmicutes bacterium]|uniref:Integral membrane protein, YjbE family n=1 Tax=Melghirimyces thermohalophilus TaxID=1236220 RepID=A0A1G6J6S0_9BACL|nr:TerC family protein [Melghirimyces thermohalophilus]MDA8353194.1 TerC family protein [Bacillota bacterium]SDC14478.1 integral membrane protein, YjbE family [Melghirimyces thermohalophilus]